ncbi:MAG: uroporphyrinogen decarboxylase family protein [Dehalococcoidales bacterium]|jgi:uroporphyrinogen-III decarboxylase
MEKEWSEMTWQEKREQRFSRWLSAADVKFKNPEAAKKYKVRATRMIKAIKMEIPDRVPVHIAANSFVAYNAGYTLKDVLYDYSKIYPAWEKFITEFDQDSNDTPGFFPARVYELLGNQITKWPGGGLPDNASLQNFVEKDYMQADEYDLFMKDQFDFGTRFFTPRTWSAFAPLAKLPPLTSYQGLPNQLMALCLDPEFRQMFKKIQAAAAEQAKFNEVMGKCARLSIESGYPPLAGGVMLAPFDTVADMLRGTHGSVMDMYRQPEKLLESLEVIAEHSIKSTVNMAAMSRSPIVFVPMHKGDDSFMSVKQFEKFYWPTFRKLLLGVVDAGLVPMMVIDGSYNEQRLKIISELPRTCCVWTMEKTDMFKAKDILGNAACISGNVTAAQLYTQQPPAIKEYCRKLIEYCGQGGGYILSLGSGIDKCNPANLHAIVEAAEEYGYY